MKTTHMLQHSSGKRCSLAYLCAAVMVGVGAWSAQAGNFDFHFDSVSNYGQLILTLSTPVNVSGAQQTFDTSIKSQGTASLRHQGTNNSQSFGRFPTLLDVGIITASGGQDLSRTNTFFTLDFRVENTPSFPASDAIMDIRLYAGGTPSAPANQAARFFLSGAMFANTGPTFVTLTQYIVKANGSLGDGFVTGDGDTNLLNAVKFISIPSQWSSGSPTVNALDYHVDNFRLFGPAVIPEPGMSTLTLLGMAALITLRSVRKGL